MATTIDDRQELLECFQAIDSNKDGYIDLTELRNALDQCGFKMPGYKVRQMAEEYAAKRRPQEQGRLSFDEFEKLCKELRASEPSSSFKQVVSKKENLEIISGLSTASSEGTTHSVRLEEQLAFSDWINTNLAHDKDLKHLLPIDAEGKTLYDKFKDGILLCKIVNHSCPDTIDERTINKKNLTLYRAHENLTLALRSAQSIGCNIINIDAHDLTKGSPHLILGLLWQVIRVGLFNQITLENCPGLARLLQDGERIEDLLRLSPEDILLRWVNHHLTNAGINRRCTNFYSDITDSEIYSHLIHQIAPKEAGVSLEALMEPSHINRAEVMLRQAAKIDCRSFVTASDVVNGIHKLNLAFVANMFNKYPGLDKLEEDNIETVEESREEKTYRNWMNSLGVSPYVNWLYSDLADGLVFFQLFDIIKPGSVNWTRVHKKFSKLRMFMEKLENCNYVVELGRQMNFSLVGIAGQDLNDGTVTLTLALTWQLMRSYTLSILSGITDRPGGIVVEKEIVRWANSKLASAGKASSIKSFQDYSIADGKVVLDLIDAIKPGTVNYDLVKEGGNEQDNLDNAKYALSLARKAGARVYALPEDITEVKQKMVMTVFACLMATDYVPGANNSNSQQTNNTESKNHSAE
ncbi:plastin-1 [Copidosoma floridanum]|uniref:plastin-1 n=1 Tax=Copidosoma floridanum TaxID=29053 RepID=UPI0006C9CA0D|nr:plastin-1 [Copidosoma floridanum]